MPLPSGNVVMFQILQQRHLSGIRSPSATFGHPEKGVPGVPGCGAPLVETWRYYLKDNGRSGKIYGRTMGNFPLWFPTILKKKQTVSCGLVSRGIGSIIPGTMDINGQ